ncbi:hypothetical protein OJ879_004597 [Salmonella enterica subsp. enterica serovar Kentucky]|nr:hypothetical protein [Salmonella enterica subsp. enterica serovar Kentucky]EGG8160240.1 hypothetical protein [Salmonella enterica subsp. enterica serovar Kentucky]EGH4663129.1 hypothetical protein [Salmonella enterica subsp. enterica serovar Kentucky]EHS2502410.1 hypothetical protein [Salmonella enterica subsp. enterica serovar Kentucky]EIE7037381.1 hypothetical protein [Salmonella enterica subsp. enterica serovar Kentucky]
MQFKNFNDSKILQDYDVLNGYINALLSGDNIEYINELISKLEDLQKHFRKILSLN